MDNENDQQKQEKKEKRLNELLTSSIVDIYVGPESTHWPLHERLICYHSKFLSNVFYSEDKDASKKSRGQKSYGLPDEDEHTFELLVGWLYSKSIRRPEQERDLGPLLELYLLAQKLEMEKLSEDVTELVREFYHSTSTYPGLRRVQYIYAETDEDNEMRELMVSSVARQLTTADKLPVHWVKALQRNGQLAVDIIRAIQQWNLEERSIPDFRDASRTRGRQQAGFSEIAREGESLETEVTGDTNLGVESLASDLETSQIKSDDEQEEEESEEVAEEYPPNHSAKTEQQHRVLPDKSDTKKRNINLREWRQFAADEIKDRPESIFILLLWIGLLSYYGYGALR